MAIVLLERLCTSEIIRIFVAMPKSDIIFLTGLGRSGTSMLQAILDAHSRINFPPETHFFKRYVLPCLSSGKLPEETVLKKDAYLMRLGQDHLEELSLGGAKSLEELLDMFLKIMEDGNTPFIGDKDTEYVRYLSHLNHLFPDAYLIHIMRDPRDVVASRTKAKWGSKRSLAFHAAEYEYYIHKLTRLGPLLFKERYIEIRYEDLIEDPEYELSRLLEKMDLEFESDMLDFHKSSSKLVADNEASWKGNVSKPIMKSNKNKWKKHLTLKQAGLVQAGIADFMRVNHYELIDAQPSVLEVLRKYLIKILFALKTFKERLR